MSDLRKRQVAQGNPLARSAQQMDIHEKRLVLFAISQIRWDQEEFQPLELFIADLKNILGSNNKNIYALASKGARRLLKRTIFIGGEGEDDPWTEFQWVSRCTYIPASKRPDKQSVIVLEFHQGLKPFLLQLRENYNSIPLIELLSVPSFNSMRLFEILYHDSHRGQRTFLTYDIEDLKKRIGLEGKYTRFKDFRYVLDRALQDFEQHTSLTFSYQGIGRNRSYRQIRFCIERNENYRPPAALREASMAATVEAPHYSLEELQLAQALVGVGFSQNPFDTIRTYGLERVKNNLQLAQKKAREAAGSRNPIKNLGGLIAYMIKNDVAGGEVAAQQEEASDKKIAATVELLEKSFTHEQTHFWRGFWSELAAEEQDALNDILRVSLNPAMLRLLERENWSGPLTEAQRHLMLTREHFQSLPESLRSVETFVAESDLLGEFGLETKQAIIDQVKERLA